MNMLVKICGITTHAALAAALDGGVDMVGLVFCRTSPRHLSPSQATGLAHAARGRAAVVAVVVEPADSELEEIVAAVEPDFIQLHGGETQARLAAVRGRTGRKLIKAIPIGGREDLAALPGFSGLADHLLLDSRAPTGARRPGGHGQSFDWQILRQVTEPFILSGGLHPGNVAAAIETARPAGVDVSSGVETSPGVKDPVLIRRFIVAARQAAAHRQAPPRAVLTELAR